MIPDRISSAFQTAAQGLSVQRERINAASRNIANINTSAPEGSGRGYRPQTVRSSGPAPSSFKNALVDSMSSVKQTRANHLSGAPVGDQQMQKGQGLGPTFEVVEQNNFRYEYDPNHPDANEEGMVRYPDIDMVREMAELVSANKLYEANLSSIEAEKEIMRRSMQI